MSPPSFDNASLTVALAMLAGVLAQALARHLRVPGIVLLLGAGVAMGPDVAGLVRPATMEGALQALVGFAVAIILFEGGLNLDLRRLRLQAKPIRRLVTAGALVTGAGGAVAARVIMGWDWRLSALLGTLVIVTGPTVITPLLRRIKVLPRVATVLEAEGVFIDAVGATVAVVALEVALAPSRETLGAGIVNIAMRIGLGAAVGLAGGLLLALLLRRRRVVPEGLENILSLAFALAVYQGSNAIMPESGIPAAIVAGITLGNTRTHALQDLLDFKEQLTEFFIATLFVLLVADVRLADVRALGVPGLATVAALVFAVRPLAVLASTHGTGMSGREKLFLMWVAPRGIVAAAIASLFAIELDRAGIDGGTAMRALVFLVIAITVTLQGLTAGLVARGLGVRRRHDIGFLLLGANPVGRALGDALRRQGEEVTFVDTNPGACHRAEEAGFAVYRANGLEERTLVRVDAEAFRGCVGVTQNEEVNFLFAQKVRETLRGTDAYAAIDSATEGIDDGMVAGIGARVALGGACAIGTWAGRVAREQVTRERWRLDEVQRDGRSELGPHGGVILPLTVSRSGRARPLAANVRLRKGDEVELAVHDESAEAAHELLSRGGWTRIDTAHRDRDRDDEGAERESTDGEAPSGITRSGDVST